MCNQWLLACWTGDYFGVLADRSAGRRVEQVSDVLRYMDMVTLRNAAAEWRWVDVADVVGDEVVSLNASIDLGADAICDPTRIRSYVAYTHRKSLYLQSNLINALMVLTLPAARCVCAVWNVALAPRDAAVDVLPTVAAPPSPSVAAPPASPAAAGETGRGCGVAVLSKRNDAVSCWFQTRAR